MNVIFTKSLALEEVSKAITSLPMNEALRWDGIHIKFFQENIEATTIDLLKAFENILDRDKILVNLTTWMVILIPKKGDTFLIINLYQGCDDFVRLVCIKFLQKIWPLKFFPFVISPNYIRFVRCHNIIDNIFLANGDIRLNHKWALFEHFDIFIDRNFATYMILVRKDQLVRTYLVKYFLIVLGSDMLHLVICNLENDIYFRQ